MTEEYNVKIPKQLFKDIQREIDFHKSIHGKIEKQFVNPKTDKEENDPTI